MNTRSFSCEDSCFPHQITFLEYLFGCVALPQQSKLCFSQKCLLFWWSRLESFWEIKKCFFKELFQLISRQWNRSRGGMKLKGKWAGRPTIPFWTLGSWDRGHETFVTTRCPMKASCAVEEALHLRIYLLPTDTSCPWSLEHVIFRGQLTPVSFSFFFLFEVIWKDTKAEIDAQ